MSEFQGFPPERFTFFSGLEKDNSKVYWVANKATWDNCVRAPLIALLAELDAEFPPLKMFRPNRDLRFSQDTSPYKLWAGATRDSRAGGSTGYYLRVGASGPDDRLRSHAAGTRAAWLRASLDHEASGRQFEDLTRQLSAGSLPVTSGATPEKDAAGLSERPPRLVTPLWTHGAS